MKNDNNYITINEYVEAIEKSIRKSKDRKKKTITVALDHLHAVKNACELCGNHLANLINSETEDLDVSYITLSDKYAVFDTAHIIALTCDHIVLGTIDRVIEKKLKALKEFMFGTMLKDYTYKLPDIQEKIEMIKSRLKKSETEYKKLFSKPGSNELYENITKARNEFVDCEKMLTNIIEEICDKFLLIADAEV